MTLPAPVDPFRAAFQALLNAVLPTIAFLCTYEYRVLASTVTPPITIDCVATDPPVVAKFPATLSKLVLWPGPSGSVAVPAVGSIVRIGFVNGDPSKPFVAGLDPTSPPTLVMLGGVPGAPVAGTGDVVTITPAQFAAALPTNSGGPVTTSLPMQGTISSGSATVQRRA